MKNYKIYLVHILDEIGFLEKNAMPLSKKEFIDNPVICRAALRSLEVIGEAVKCLPNDFRTLQPSIPWKEFAGLRDVLIHKYFGVDYDMVWDIITNDLPELKKSIRSITSKDL